MEKTLVASQEISNLAEKANINVEKVEFIPGGKTNKSYIVYSDKGKFLARIAGKGTENFIDRTKEIKNVSIADQIGVGPKLICFDNNNLLLEYVDGICTTEQSIIFLNNNVDKLTKQLNALHNSNENFDGEFSFIKDFNIYKKDFLTTGYPIPNEMIEHETELFEITRWVDESLNVDKCPVHSDIVLQNFIFTKERAYIIDWEYSTMADRYLDLASFCTQNILGPGADIMFLNSYFANNNQKLDYGKFLLYKMSISFMWVYWHLNNVAHDKDAEYNEYRWRMHLNNALVCKREWEKLQQSPSIFK